MRGGGKRGVLIVWMFRFACGWRVLLEFNNAFGEFATGSLIGIDIHQHESQFYLGSPCKFRSLFILYAGGISFRLVCIHGVNRKEAERYHGSQDRLRVGINTNI